MENKWQVVVVTILAVLVIAVGCLVGFRKKDSRTVETAKMEIIQYDAAEKKTEVVETFTVKENDKIELEKYNGNNLQILKIGNDEVEISRVATKYKVIDENERKSEPYEEIVKTTVKYGDTLSIDIDEWDPFGPMPGQSRFTYTIRFFKEKE